MIKRILFLLLVGLIIAGFGLVIMREAGFVVFSYGDTTVEIKLINFYFAVIALFIALYILFRLLGYIFRLPALLHNKRQQKRQLEIMHGIESSILDASEFNWEAAMRNSATHVKHSPIKRAQQILAARFANNSGNIQAREKHLAMLRKLENGKALANSFEAEFALEDSQPEKALSLLRDQNEDNLYNLNSLARAYIETDNIEGVERVLPKLHVHTGKTKWIKQTVFACLDWLIHYHDESAHAEQLAELWKTYAKHIQAEPGMLRQYVHALTKNRQDVLAEQIITTRLKESWDEQLIREYGVLTLDNVEQRIKQAEAWLNEHKESAGLLLTLGRLNKHEKLWGKAKSYLESSLSRKPLAETYAELADLHEFLDEPTEARKCAKKGLHIATRDQAIKTKRTF